MALYHVHFGCDKCDTTEFRVYRERRRMGIAFFEGEKSHPLEKHFNDAPNSNKFNLKGCLDFMHF